MRHTRRDNGKVRRVRGLVQLMALLRAENRDVGGGVYNRTEVTGSLIVRVERDGCVKASKNNRHDSGLVAPSKQRNSGCEEHVPMHKRRHGIARARGDERRLRRR
jgi:hypothetical protein